MLKNDFINTEYEARAMVSEEQYNRILAHFLSASSKKVQSVNTNTYFDYEDLYLTNNHIVLRARSINDSEFELTVKIKSENGDVEYNHLLTLNEYNEINRTAIIPDSIVKDKLIEKEVDLSGLKIIATLKTERLEIIEENYILVIDKNYFRDRVDFNVEVESTNKEKAISCLNTYFSPFGVKYKKGYISKSQRAIFNL